MPEMTSELSDVQKRSAIPKGIYPGHCTESEYLLSQERNNPMANLTWEVDEGEYAGTIIKFNNVVLGGINKQGKPINPFQLANLLDTTHIPWNCRECNNDREARRLYWGTGEDGLEKGKAYCPDCKSPTFNIGYNTDDFVGPASRCRLKVSTYKPEGKDDEFNRVDGYLPLEEEE